MINNVLLKCSSGWLGKLELIFALRKDRSILIKSSHSGPFCVQKSFYPENDVDTPNVYLLHPPGGLVGGDKLVLLVQLESGSRALLTTPSSTKFYRTNGMYALQEYTFKLASNSVLEWIPQSNIFFSETKVKIKINFEIEPGARMVSYEMLCFGNLGLNCYINPEEIDIFLNINLINSVGFRDRLKLNSTKDCINKLGGFRVSAVFFAIPSDEIILNRVRKLIKFTSIQDNHIGGATLLDKLLVVRLLGNSNQILQTLLYNIWSIIRPVVIGKKAVAPRIWFT